jgi:putative ABC transport system permease protein
VTWLRWSWRDLRSRWPQVAAIALIIALGSGLYSGLSSSTQWRRLSYDDAFRRLGMYDLRVGLTESSFADASRLDAIARSIPHASAIEHAETRLVVPTQVDASVKGKTILVPGRLVGLPVGASGPPLTKVVAKRGRELTASDAGTGRAVLDFHFADYYHLPPATTVRLSSGATLHVVGQGLAPEYLMIRTDSGSPFAQSSYAVLFTSIQDVQALSGRPGQANDVVMTLRPGTSSALVARELRAAFARELPDVGVTVKGPRGDKTYQTLYDDIDSDQTMYMVLALLVLFGAAFAAFNLTGRIVQAQRREIGIGMSLGTPPRLLAIRPLLVAFEVAALGAGFGIGVGIVVGNLMRSVNEQYFPLPQWHTPFQFGTFAVGAALGLVLPFVATILPVRAAVKVTPVEAIRTGPEQRHGRMPRLARIPLPGRTTSQMPFRNLLRTPRRTLMTAFGIAAAIAVLVAVAGLVDSTTGAVDIADHEFLGRGSNRLLFDLQQPMPADAPTVQSIRSSPLVSKTQSELRVGGTLAPNGKKIDVIINAMPLDGTVWHPTIHDRTPAAGLPGIVLTDKAAGDLGVEPGDTVTLRHPKRSGLTTFRLVDSKVRVIGTARMPVRYVVYMDTHDTGMMNLAGIVNFVVVRPAPGASAGAIERAFFGKAGVTSVVEARDFIDSIRDTLGSLVDVLTIVEIAVLLLALLIAFNSASINSDERRRDNATMFAFGLPLRRVFDMTVVEHILLGVLGTALGLVFGRLLLQWMVTSLVAGTFPDFGIQTTLSTQSIVVALGLGVLAVASAPLFTIRRMRRMDISSTLRVVE